MENYKQRLESQAAAIKADIEELIKIVKDKELDLEQAKDAKAFAQRELRSIEKKLEKLKV